MAEPFLGEIRLFSFDLNGEPPTGWLYCTGQTLPVNQYQALYSLLGNQFGGTAPTTFALPDLRGRAPVHRQILAPMQPVGQAGGAENVNLTAASVPSHAHMLTCNTAVGTLKPPDGDYYGSVNGSNHHAYGPASSQVALDNSTLTSAGGGQPHANMQPFLVLNFCIASSGQYPPRP
jgi:microcystin-dependent protein